MINPEQILLLILALTSMSAAVAVLVMLFRSVHTLGRSTRIGLTLLAFGYAMLALSLFSESLSWSRSFWIYLLSDAALIISPLILFSKNLTLEEHPSRT